LHKFVKKHEKFINMTTPLTGRYVVYLPDPYSDKSDEYIKADIRLSIFISYLAKAFEVGTTALFAEIIKKIIRFIKNDDKESENSIYQQTIKGLGLKL